MAGDLIRRAMHEGMKSIKADMVEKCEELDVSRVESDTIKELMALLEVWIAHLGYFTAQNLKSSIFEAPIFESHVVKAHFSNMFLLNRLG